MNRGESLKAVIFLKLIVLFCADKSCIKPFSPVLQKLLLERSGERTEGPEEEVRLSCAELAVQGTLKQSILALRSSGCGQALALCAKVLLGRTDTALWELSENLYH